MKTRVTITLDEAVLRKAQQTARARHTTVSGLVESLLENATRQSLAPVVDEMVGSATLRASTFGIDPLYDALKFKYLPCGADDRP